MEEGARKGWNPNKIERVGRSWTSDVADELATERSAEQDKEDCASPVEKDRPGKSRDAARKARLSSASTSSSSSSGASDQHGYQQLPTPTRSTHSQSPMQLFSPLTPSHSETSVSTMLSSVTESAEHTPLREQNDMTTASESISQINGAVKGRRKVPPALTIKESGKQHPERGSTSKSPRGSGTARPGRGRGRGVGGGGSGRKLAGGDDNRTSSAQGTGRGKAGRGANHSSSFHGGDRSKRATTH
jgi:hypothetical protein